MVSHLRVPTPISSIVPHSPVSPPKIPKRKSPIFELSALNAIVPTYDPGLID